MTEEYRQQYESRLKELIRNEITNTVGKKLDAFIEEFKDFKKTDNEWKRNAQPVINIGSEAGGFLKVGKYLILGITAIGVFIVVMAEVLGLVPKVISIK